MNKEDLRELENDIEEALDGMDYEIPYDTESYIETKDGVRYGICEVTFDVTSFDDEDAENVVADAVREWGGSYYWEDHSIIVSVRS